MSKILMLCLFAAAPAAFAGGLSCRESPKPTGNPEIDPLVVRYECRYAGSLQQAYAAFMKQGYDGKAPYPKTVPAKLPPKSLTLRGTNTEDCGNMVNEQPETLEWSLVLRYKNANRVGMKYREVDCGSGVSADTEFVRNGNRVLIVHKYYHS
ncbi:MAG: phage tail protein [Neisseria sp.]|nr:phage tail protein [Neisseria sp.]